MAKHPQRDIEDDFCQLRVGEHNGTKLCFNENYCNAQVLSIEHIERAQVTCLYSSLFQKLFKPLRKST